MTLSLISCIVPVFNGERYLGEALESIFSQTYRPLEVIVANESCTITRSAIHAAASWLYDAGALGPAPSFRQDRPAQP